VHLVTAAVAVLLLVGLWTPVVGSSVAAAAVGLAVAHPADPWTFVHLALVAGAIAMIGPGGFSIDARLFGRRQIEIPRR
jgi:hypothetical protein